MSFVPKNITQGGQITAYRFRMFNQVNNWFSFWVVLIFFAISMLVFFAFTPMSIIANGLTYWLADMSSSFLLLNPHSTVRTWSVRVYDDAGVNYTVLKFTLEQILNSKEMAEVGSMFLTRLEIYAGLGAAVSFGIYSILMFWIGRVGKEETDDEYISGMKLTQKPAEVNKILASRGKKSDLKIGKLHMVKNAEIQNFLMHGTIGTGKSTLIRYLLDYIRSRGDRAVIFDSGGTFIETHYNPETDKILNAHDERCEWWDLWHECQSVVDYENITASLIPVEGDSDPFWVSSSRTIFADSAMKMAKNENRDIESFLKILFTISLKSLREFLANTPSSNLVEEKIEKTAISIRSVITNYAKALRFLQGLEKSGKKRFSIREWMSDEEFSNSWLFISTNSKYRKSVKPLMSMWLSIATIYLQSMGENPNRRVWFILDELPSLQKVPELNETLAEARKFGGCFVIGMQNMAQLSNTYGKDTAKSLFDLMNTRFYGRSPSAEVAKDIEQELGNQRRKEAREQNSFGLDQVRDGISIGRDKVSQPIVDYDEIMRMADLNFYVRLPGDYPVINMDVPYRDLPKKHPALIERKIDDKLSPLLEELIVHNEKGMNTDFQNQIIENHATLTSTAPEQKTAVVTPPVASTAPEQKTVAAPQSVASTAPKQQTLVLTQPVAGSAQVSKSEETALAFTITMQERLAKLRADNQRVETQNNAQNIGLPVQSHTEISAEKSTGNTDAFKFIDPRRKQSNDNTGDQSGGRSEELEFEAIVYETESGAMVIKTEGSEITQNQGAVRKMAEEEKNILVHREHGEHEMEEPEL